MKALQNIMKQFTCRLPVLNVLATLVMVLLPFVLLAQDEEPDADTTTQKDSVYKNERFSYHAQLTAIDQHQLPFNAPYAGKNSLPSVQSPCLSVTSTLFAGMRLWKGAEAYIDPELSGGKGIGGTTGIAGFPNGEIYRVGEVEPVVTVARIFLRQTFDLSGNQVNTETGQNEMQGHVSDNRLVITAGKFSITDIFDANTYSHDPRNQFMNWSIMSAGAWDYPANTRGYTEGIAAELIKPRWALRAASVMVPAQANGQEMDVNVLQANSETVEYDRFYNFRKRPGILRLLVFNTLAHMGNYEEAITDTQYHLDITKTRAYGRTKTGFVINAEQELSNSIGVFGRLSYNDGKNETWAFTEIDRSLNIGMLAKGTGWHRPNDNIGVALVFNGLSNEHREYLADGGYGFIIGDGKLNYGLESILEVYYNVRVFKTFWIAPDYQFVLNPAYNKDRGPVNVWGIRGHIEF